MRLSIFSRSGGSLNKYYTHCTSDFNLFVQWIQSSSDYVAIDIETNVVDSVLDREITTVAFFRDDHSWVIFFQELKSEEITQLAKCINDSKLIGQGMKFEMNAMRKHGVVIENYYDTMLAEKLLNMGKDVQRNDLSSILKKYLDIDMDKELQTSFNSCSTISDEQMKYIILDVIHLHTVKSIQIEDMRNHDALLQKNFNSNKNRGLIKTNWWNHEFYKVIADMEYKGVMLNVDKWKDLYAKAKPLVSKATKNLDAIVFKDFYDKAVEDGFLYDKDTFIPKLLSSRNNKKSLLNIIYPDLENVSLLEITKYLQANDPNWPKDLKPTSKRVVAYASELKGEEWVALKLLILKKDDYVKKLFYMNFRDELLSKGLLIEKDTVNILWTSHVQRKQIFKWIAPELESTDREHLEEVAYKHVLIATYLTDYQKYVGMVTKFGLNYLEHVEADGRVRTNINPIINTGRISSSKPNLLNIINNADYRAAFYAPDGYKFVMTDYQGEELVLTAFFAAEKLWTDAIKAGHDLHSVNGSAIFSKEWKAGEESDCSFAIDKSKCKCKVHKKLRQDTKALEFGSLYGMSKFGMAFKLKISVEEADSTLKEFFKKLPNINRFLKGMSNFAVKNLYSPELVLGACRFVDKRKVHYDRGSVQRTASNFSIQGAGASVLKIAAVLIRRHIKQMKHDATIIIAPYDEIIMEVREDIAEYWKVKLQYYMELAGQLALQNPILKTDVPIIGDYWIH